MRKQEKRMLPRFLDELVFHLSNIIAGRIVNAEKKRKKTVKKKERRKDKQKEREERRRKKNKRRKTGHNE
jgi:hypothetical protein